MACHCIYMMSYCFKTSAIIVHFLSKYIFGDFGKWMIKLPLFSSYFFSNAIKLLQNNSKSKKNNESVRVALIKGSK